MNFNWVRYLSLVCCVAGPLLAVSFRDRWLDPVLVGLSHDAQHGVLYLVALLIVLYGALCGWVLTTVRNAPFYKRAVMAGLGAVAALFAAAVRSLF